MYRLLDIIQIFNQHFGTIIELFSVTNTYYYEKTIIFTSNFIINSM